MGQQNSFIRNMDLQRTVLPSRNNYVENKALQEQISGKHTNIMAIKVYVHVIGCSI